MKKEYFSKFEFRKIGLVVFILFFLLSCASNTAKRHKNRGTDLYHLSETPTSFAQVLYNSKIIQEAASPIEVRNITSLSDKGQAQYIKSLEQKYPDPKDFIKQLNTNFNFNPPKKENVKIISKSVRRKINFTINRQYYRDGGEHVVFNLPGDRLAYLELSLKIPNDSPIIFNSWDKYETKYTTINLGKITSTQQFNATASLNAKATGEMSVNAGTTSEGTNTDREVIVINGGSVPNTTAQTAELIATLKQSGSSNNIVKAGTDLGGSLQAGYQDKSETSQELSSRIMDLSGSLTEKELLLRQDGAYGIDLGGNVSITVDYLLKVDWALSEQYIKFKDLFKEDGKPIAADALNYNFITVLFPDVQKDVQGSLTYTFLYRQVNKGNQHLPESKQKITYQFGTVDEKQNIYLKKEDTFLIKKEDIRPVFYTLEIQGKEIKFKNEILKFESALDAVNFLHYLRELKRLRFDLRTFVFDNSSLSEEHINNIKIQSKNF